MTGGRRRGLTRLALALGIPYFGWWALTGWLAYTGVPIYLRHHDEALKKGDLDTAIIWMDSVNNASAALERSMLWGVVVPILALVIGAIGYWVYRGFRPKT